MSRVTNTQILAAIQGMVQQVDSLNERVNALEGKNAAPKRKPVAPAIEEHILHVVDTVKGRGGPDQTTTR